MVTLALSLVTATHLWINGSNTLVKVCYYYADYEVSRNYYYSPARKVVSRNSQCPSTITVTKY